MEAASNKELAQAFDGIKWDYVVGGVSASDGYVYMLVNSFHPLTAVVLSVFFHFILFFCDFESESSLSFVIHISYHNHD